MDDIRLSGAQRAGWFVVGLVGGIFGVLVASLANIGRAWRSTATKMALIGMGTNFGLCVIRICLNGDLDSYLFALVYILYVLFGGLGIA